MRELIRGGVILGVLLVAGCVPQPAADEPVAGQSAEAGDATTGQAPDPDGTISVIPVAAIDGADRVAVADAVSILVPPSMTESTRQIDGSTLTQLAGDDGVPTVGVLVTEEAARVDDAFVIQAVAAAATQMLTSGAAADVEQQAVSWQSMPFATSYTATVTDSTGNAWDQLYIGLRDESQTTIVSIWALAPTGGLDGSLSRQVLASLLWS